MTQHYTQNKDQVMLVTSTIRRLHPGSTAAFPFTASSYCGYSTSSS